jgi:hypothetical protein
MDNIDIIHRVSADAARDVVCTIGTEQFEKCDSVSTAIDIHIHAVCSLLKMYSELSGSSHIGEIAEIQSFVNTLGGVHKSLATERKAINDDAAEITPLQQSEFKLLNLTEGFDMKMIELAVRTFKHNMVMVGIANATASTFGIMLQNSPFSEDDVIKHVAENAPSDGVLRIPTTDSPSNDVASRFDIIAATVETMHDTIVRSVATSMSTAARSAISKLHSIDNKKSAQHVAMLFARERQIKALRVMYIEGVPDDCGSEYVKQCMRVAVLNMTIITAVSNSVTQQAKISHLVSELNAIEPAGVFDAESGYDAKLIQVTEVTMSNESKLDCDSEHIGGLVQVCIDTSVFDVTQIRARAISDATAAGGEDAVINLLQTICT